MIRVLLTRNALHNMLLRQAIQQQKSAADIVVLEAPLLEQVPVAGSAEHLLDYLRGRIVQDVIFISPSSVDFGAEKILQNIVLQRVFAVGKGTANLLKKKLAKVFSENNNNVMVIFPQSSAGSDALLNLPEMQMVKERQILIVTGSDGKPHLENELLQRGAKVVRWECYQRQKPAELTMQMETIFAEALDYVFLHSAHAAKHFLEEIPNGSASSSVTAIVGAESIAEELTQQVWPGIIKVADSPMPKDMLKAFQQCQPKK